ncbi:hypothetical protein K1719_027151 [Acacia pycnantha]|nr:hypothetical protein K1719_027151 [Acacia pycnantha]
MEAGLVEHGRDRVGHVNKVGYRFIGKKRKPYRRVRRSPTVSKARQELFVSCRDTFKGPGTVPSSQDVQKLCHILDAVEPEDFGLSSDLHFFKPGNVFRENPRVTYTTIYQCENFSLCIFFLPATAVIPLHNHPGMTVFSKLLLGQMHVKSYDLVDPIIPETSENTSRPSQLKLAKLKTDKVFNSPCDTSVLYPTTGGNIHEFTAITPCAVLDVLGPPYSKQDDRDCSYYRDHPYTAFSNGEINRAWAKDENGRFGWLEEIERPENSQMDGIEYLGPPIIEPGS